jgi:cytoskeletal protein RodZ
MLYEDEFEKQLKEKSDQFKMYPSDKIWNEVYSNLHTRRRRFIAGMTVLIGGILVLAGSQLIFPSKNVSSKSISAKINEPVKTTAGGETHKFTADNFTASQSDRTNNPPASSSGLTEDEPFILGKSLSSESQTISTETRPSQGAAIQTSSRIKPMQAAVVTVSAKSPASPDMQELTSYEPESVNNARVNPLSPELSPEKSVTQLSHIRNDRFSWEIYIAPTVNTHYLYGLNYQTMSQSVQSTPIRVGYFTNVNGLVDNTPLLGYDVGGNILYRITRNISLKAGLAFSFSRYYIKTYNSNSPQASSTLNSYLGYIADSLLNYNSGGSGINKNPQHYQNRYYQLSLPVGFEMKVAGKGKIQLHLGATIQPSYLLNTDSYVLSEDYNSYIKDPQAFRRWNLNVGGEAYISYAVGKIRWELGPQVKYQLFSTYKNSSPLQENMLNYGIRIGISKTIR